MKKKRLVNIIAFTAAVLAVAPLAATSGRMQGEVQDPDGAALPGVTVTLRSPQMMGERIATTDADGSYAFPAIPPGTYSVSAMLDGFITQEQAGIAVNANRTSEVDFTLDSGSFEESVVVTGEAPIFDPEQTSVTEIYTEEYLQGATVGTISRSYQSVLSQSAGATGGSNPNVFGATGGENAWVIDGFDTTDPVTSTFNLNLNFDTIAEINLEKGGYEAEFGRAVGAVVNVITKSGGNDFSGTFDYRFRDSGFATDGEHFNTEDNETEFQEPAFTLGGPISRDSVWFFVAANQVNSERTPSGATSTRDFEGLNLMGKLTWQASDQWTVVGRYIGEDADIANASASRLTAPEANRLQEQPSALVGFDVLGFVNANLQLQFKAGEMTSELNSFPQSGDLVTHGHITRGGVRSVNYTNEQYSNRDRTEIEGNVTWFLDTGRGDHEFKFGLGASELDFISENNTVGDYYFQDNFDGSPYVYWFDPSVPAANFTGDMISAFAQDTWRLNDRLTFKIGARLDQVAFDNEAGIEVADLDKLQPRLGFAYDATGNGRTIVSGHVGRYMHPNATTLPSFTRTDSLPSFRYISCTTFLPLFFGVPGDQCATVIPQVWAPPQITVGGVTIDTYIADQQGFDPNGWFIFDWFGGGGANTVAADLDATYADEILLSVQRQIGQNGALSFHYVDKETEDIFEDTCNGNIGGFSADAACDFYVMANLPGLSRQYQGFIVEYEHRTARTHTKASFTQADSEGNVGYNQNAGSDFDFFPDHVENRYGRLYDPEQAIRVNGYVNLPLDFTVGYDLSWDSEFSYEARDSSDIYGEVFLEPRGSRDGNKIMRLDLEVRKGFDIGETKVQLIGSVYNALDDEDMFSLCDLVNGCGSLAFEEGLTYRQPRNYEAGVRVTW